MTEYKFKNTKQVIKALEEILKIELKGEGDESWSLGRSVLYYRNTLRGMIIALENINKTENEETK